MPYLLANRVFTDLAPSRKKNSHLFKCKRGSCRALATLSPWLHNVCIHHLERMGGRLPKGHTHTHAPLPATHPQHSQTRHPPPTAPFYCNASSSGARDPNMKPTLDLFNGFVFVFIDFLIVFMFVSGQHLGFSLLSMSCSAAGSFKAFLDRDGRIYFSSCLFPLSGFHHFKKLLGPKFLQRKLTE